MQFGRLALAWLVLAFIISRCGTVAAGTSPVERITLAGEGRAVSDWFPLTIRNPDPTGRDHFGRAVAALGHDRVVVGSPNVLASQNAGTAYLFSASGAPLATFVNPSGAVGDEFGSVVAAVGNDLVIVGAPYNSSTAPYSGAAYLFRTNGTLLTAFHNPTPAAADLFGSSIAPLGGDRVLIGAPSDDTRTTEAGAAYLFRTNGDLLATFYHPTPAVRDAFGSVVGALGNDRVLIVAAWDDADWWDAGAAYLFSTNGNLLASFHHPAAFSDDRFGNAVTAVGNDLILIGSWVDDKGWVDVGRAYLFSTNGALVGTFNTPNPASGELFGASVAALGSDRVVIGAAGHNYGDIEAGGVERAGAAYLFGTNGTLLASFNNPSPFPNDRFGAAVAAVRNDRVLIGASGDGGGFEDVGRAYLFSAQTNALTLTIVPFGLGEVHISWVPVEGFVLQEASSLSFGNWKNASSGTTNPVVVPDTGRSRFFRIFKQ